MYAIVPLFICGLWLCTSGKLTTREKWVTRNMSPFLFSNQTKDRMTPSFEPNTKWNGSVPPTKQLLEPFHSKNMGWSHSIPSRSLTKRIFSHRKLYQEYLYISQIQTHFFIFRSLHTKYLCIPNPNPLLYIPFHTEYLYIPNQNQFLYIPSRILFPHLVAIQMPPQ